MNWYGMSRKPCSVCSKVVRTNTLSPYADFSAWRICPECKAEKDAGKRADFLNGTWTTSPPAPVNVSYSAGGWMSGAIGGMIPMASARALVKASADTPPRKESGAVRMFRVWRMTTRELVVNTAPLAVQSPPEKLRLGALMSAHIWQPGENTADQPRFGFYGFCSYGTMMQQEPDCRTINKARVAGTVLAYGRVTIGKYGARAQHAIIESLIEPEDLDDAMRVVHLANHYGARIISEDIARNLKGGLVPYRKGQDL